MAERLLVAYDGSACADKAVEYALQQAVRDHAELFVLALAPDAIDLGAGPSPASRLTDDLIAFARAGKRLGVVVDGSYLDEPSIGLLRQVLANHRIDHLIVARCDSGDGASRNGRLLQVLADECPVEVTVLDERSLP